MYNTCNWNVRRDIGTEVITASWKFSKRNDRNQCKDLRHWKIIQEMRFTKQKWAAENQRQRKEKWWKKPETSATLPTGGKE